MRAIVAIIALAAAAHDFPAQDTFGNAREAPTPATTHQPRATSDEPRATSYELRATSHELRITNYAPRATNNEPRTTSYEQRATEREALVRKLAAEGIRDPRVLAAMRHVPRHLFVPESIQSMSYVDTPLPIGHGQTISQPYIVAIMSELLRISPRDRVLEIGSGSGYQAAILAELAGEVWTIELEPELARTAADRLRAMAYANVVVRQGDGYLGWPEKAPFDRIILTAAPPEIPQTLIDQLKPGGRLVAPAGSRDQQLFVLDKAADGRITRRAVLDVRFVPMRKPAH